MGEVVAVMIVLLVLRTVAASVFRSHPALQRVRGAQYDRCHCPWQEQKSSSVRSAAHFQRKDYFYRNPRIRRFAVRSAAPGPPCRQKKEGAWRPPIAALSDGNQRLCPAPLPRYFPGLSASLCICSAFPVGTLVGGFCLFNCALDQERFGPGPDCKVCDRCHVCRNRRSS